MAMLCDAVLLAEHLSQVILEQLQFTAVLINKSTAQGELEHAGVSEIIMRELLYSAVTTPTHTQRCLHNVCLA